MHSLHYYLNLRGRNWLVVVIIISRQMLNRNHINMAESVELTLGHKFL